MLDTTGLVIVMVGPPNAGKGTQVELLAEHLQAVHFSVGDLLRTENNPDIMGYLNEGGLVPSDHIRELLLQAISNVPLEQPIVFDGAKKLAEAQWLVDFLPTVGRRLERVISLVLDEAEARKRSAKRASGRPDDAPELQGKRWRMYHEGVVPALDFYRSRGLLVEVDALGSVDEVAERVWQVLAA